MVIDTVVEDVYNLLSADTLHEIPEDLLNDFLDNMADLAKTRIARTPSDGPRALRISQVGKPCERQNWYNIHEPEGLESLRAETRIKFLYGDVVEELLLFLVELAGHTVEGRQDRLEVAGVPGHRDAVIDGTLCDVKTASSFSFKKFRDGDLNSGNDSFGYIGQIQTYLEACQDDPIVTDKDRCAFLVMDKTLGHLCLDVHDRIQGVDIRALTAAKKLRSESKEPPKRAFSPVPDGASGNMKLPMECSYCNAKKMCYPQARTFLYSNGPRHLTTVKKEPNVPEAT